MDIRNSTNEDVGKILKLYKIATGYQKAKLSTPWPEFDKNLIRTEISENRQWKIVVDNSIACIWVTTFSDPLIWEDKNNDPAVYIHRIATNPDFRGRNLVLVIVEWAKKYAEENGKKFIRLDIVGKNENLIAHYQKCGFNFLGLSKLRNTNGLPQHYDNATVSLLELPLNGKAK